MVNFYQPEGRMHYKAPNSTPVAFDFTEGISLEWKMWLHYGSVNCGFFFSLYDASLNKSANFRFYYGTGAPGENRYGLIEVGGLEKFPFNMHNSQWDHTNGWHTFRITVQGDVLKLYIDTFWEPDGGTWSGLQEYLVLQTTGATEAGAGPLGGGPLANNFAWGVTGLDWSNTLAVDWDYIRWTVNGAAEPPTECQLLWRGGGGIKLLR